MDGVAEFERCKCLNSGGSEHRDVRHDPAKTAEPAFATPSQDEHHAYVIPLRYVLYDGMLWGVAQQGRKLELAAEVPRIGFQVDTTAATGAFVWNSVMGTGSFALVSEPEEIRIVGEALRQRFADAPEWWREEQAAFGREGELIFWRIEPDTLSGRAEGP